MVLTQKFNVTASERMDMEKLAGVLNDAITAISGKTGLPENDVLDILEKVRVARVGDLRHAVRSLEDQGAIPAVDPGLLGMALEEAILAIADATDLSTDEITDVLTMERGATFDHVIMHLRTRSCVGRSNHV